MKPNGPAFRRGPGAYQTIDPPEEAGPDLRAALAVLWRGKWILLVCVALALGLARLHAARQTPLYRAQATVLFDSAQANVADIDRVVEGGVPRDLLRNEVEVLRSTALLGRVVDRLDLTRRPEFNAALRPPQPSVWARLGVEGWLRDLGALPPVPPAAPAPGDPRPGAIGALRGALEIRPIRESTVIAIAATTTDPHLAAAVANGVAEAYLTDQLEARLQSMRDATAWLATRTEELRIRVQEAEAAVEDRRAALARDAGQTSAVTRQRIEALNRALTTAQADASARAATLARLRAALAEGQDLGAVTEFRESRIIARFREEEADLTAQRAALASRVADDHPSAVALDSQIAGVRQEIANEAFRATEATAADLAAAEALVADLEAEIAQLEARALAQARDELSLRELEREAQASRLLYENILARVQETTRQEDLQTAGARILSPAEPPGGALANRATRTQILALMAGLGLGLGLIVLRERLANTLRTPAEAEALTDLPVLALLPRARPRGPLPDAVTEGRAPPLAEAVRNLRTSLFFAGPEAPPAVVVVTSSVPGEGKSTTALLLARAAAQIDRRAVILDCDLRQPALAGLLGVSPEAGLIDVLEGTVSLDAALIADPTGLAAIASRPLRGGLRNAADVLASRAFRELIATLRERFELVVLDTPPVVVVPDARIAAGRADAVVYAVRWDHTPKGAVTEGLAELRGVAAPLAGVALTQVDEGRAARLSQSGGYAARYRGYYAQ